MSHDHASSQFDEYQTIDARYPTPDIADVQLVDVLRALSDATRLGIVQRIADGDPHAKGPIVNSLDCTKSTVAHHFRILREAGVTRTIVSGRTHTIQLRRDELETRFPGLIDALTRS